MKKGRRHYLNVLDQLRLAEHSLCNHTILIGQTGSGKTTLLRLLTAGFLFLVAPGALHCCVKADEADWICKLVRTTPLRDRLVRLVPGRFTFNIASYECFRRGGTPASLTRLLIRLNDQLKRNKEGDSEQSFWKGLFFDFMHSAITIAKLAHGPLMTLEHVYDIITTSPGSIEELTSERFRDSPCWQMLKLAESRLSNEADARALQKAASFFLSKQVSLGSKARAAGVQECSSILGIFLLSPFYETVCAAESSFTPRLPLNQYYVVIDAPVLVYQEAGQLLQSLITMMTIDAALRRRHPETYTIIVRDELQMLVSDPLYETLVHSVARSHKLGFISAVQNLPLLQSAFGGDAKAEQHMKSLLGNYVNKFALANGCMDTNQFFSTSYGQHKEQFCNLNERQQGEDNDVFDALLGQHRFTFGTSESYADRVPPDRFLHLRRGGPPDFLIDAYMSRSGQVFPDTGLPYKLVTFSQR